MTKERCGGCLRPMTANPCALCGWKLPPSEDSLIAGGLALIAAVVGVGTLVLLLGH